MTDVKTQKRVFTRPKSLSEYDEIPENIQVRKRVSKRNNNIETKIKLDDYHDMLNDEQLTNNKPPSLTSNEASVPKNNELIENTLIKDDESNISFEIKKKDEMEKELEIEDYEALGKTSILFVRIAYSLSIHFSKIFFYQFKSYLSMMPKPIQTFVDSNGAIVNIIGQALEICLTIFLIFIEALVIIISDIWKFLYPYQPQYLIKLAAGLLICFFGGLFSATISIFEAAKLCALRNELNSIVEVLSRIEERKDYLIKEEQQFSDSISPRKPKRSSFCEFPNESIENEEIRTESSENMQTYNESILRKLYILLASLDPNLLTKVVLVVNTTLITIVTTLKVQFAKTIALGNSISIILQKSSLPIILPIIKKYIPKDLEKWTDNIAIFGFKIIAIFLAWTFRKVISSYHSAIRGGFMVGENLITYLIQMKFIDPSVKESNIVQIFSYSLALAGIFFQLSIRYSLPYPFNIILFPLIVFENLLVWIANHTLFYT